MFLALCQYDGRTAFFDDRDHFVADEPVSDLVVHHFSAEIVELYPLVGMELAQRTECRRANEDMMLERSGDRLTFCIHAVANCSALHEHDGMMPVFSRDCRSQSREVPCLRTARDLLEAVRRKVVAFVDDDMTVADDTIVNHPSTHKALKQSNVESSGKFLSSAADLANQFLRQVKKGTKPLNPLIKQLLSMHQHERIRATLCDQPRANDRFSECSRGGENTGIAR